MVLSHRLNREPSWGAHPAGTRTPAHGDSTALPGRPPPVAPPPSQANDFRGSQFRPLFRSTTAVTAPWDGGRGLDISYFSIKNKTRRAPMPGAST